VDSRRGGASQVRGTLGVTGPESSPAVAEDEEGDEVEPVRGSPGHERRWRGGVAAMKNGGRLSARKLESEGRRCGGGRGWRCPFIGVRGGPGRWQRAMVNGVYAINGRAGFSGGLRLGIQGGGVTA
jgi:hypothetical protein